MRKVLRRSGLLALLVGLLTVGGAGVGASTASAVSLNCAVGDTSPCLKYCTVGVNSYPCGVGRVPNVTSGSYSYSIPLSAAEQDATHVAGDPGGTGTANITMNAGTNTVCATTTWSGIDTPVVWAHIHGGQHGLPEDPAISIQLFPANFLNGQPSGISSCTTAPGAEIWLIHQCPSQFNVVVHSQGKPAGAIRGQFPGGCTA
jgi:hypothetical protein